MSHQARNTLKNKLTILGSGTSTGVPIIGCSCQVCQSSDPQDKRRRMSVFLQTAAGQHILVDSSADMRQQMLEENITHLDAVIITHAHADHIQGIDDLRAFTYGRDEPLKLYTNQATADVLIQKYDYIFQEIEVLGGEVAKLEMIIMKPGSTQKIGGEDFYIDELPHGNINTISFIHQGFAYLTDCAEIPQTYLDKLTSQSLDLMLIDCASIKPHRTHLHYDKSLKYSQIIKAQRTGLIHISHTHSQRQLTAQFQSEMNSEKAFVAYDSQVLQY